MLTARVGADLMGQPHVTRHVVRPPGDDPAWATDTSRLYQWAAPPVILAAMTVLPPRWAFLALLAHLFNPWAGSAEVWACGVVVRTGEILASGPANRPAAGR